MTRWLAASLFVLMGVSMGCGDPSMVPLVGPPQAEPDPGWEGPRDEAESRLRGQIDQMLSRVSRKRELAPRAKVAGRLLDRDEVIRLIMQKSEKELPEGVLEAQGELLRAFALIPADYEFVNGVYDLIQDNLAGFYDQDTNEMYLIDDLPESGARETLAHELVHALQDQHFDLGAMLDYRPGEADAITAAHALAEGDAMSAMMDVTLGDAFKVSVGALRIMMVASVAFSSSGAATPRVLQAALVAPYIDGFRFVQALRMRGDWGAVDAAYARLPTTTEQLLHLDKYDAAEAPLPVSIPALGEGWAQADADVLGEQGLRMVLEQCGPTKGAASAAAGWGGDRFLVAHRASTGEWTASWLIHFDTDADAAEAEAFIAKHHPDACAERPDLGPIAYRRAGAAFAIVGGPYAKAKDGKLSSTATCADADARLSQILAP